MSSMIPSRVCNLEAARKLYGARADFYVGFLTRSDDLADAVIEALAALPKHVGTRMVDTALAKGIDAVADAPDALRRLFAQVDDIPAWVDWDRLRLGARTYQRTGMAGSLILSAFSLMNGYHSHAAAKALVFTGQLDRMARRRLAETGRFIADTIQVDGLRRDAQGFASTLKVRLVHAQVRRFLLRSGQWDTEAWGLPINQADMAATNMAFSIAVLHGTRIMGLRFRTDEADSLMALWRYSGYLSGVDPGLLCSSEREGMEWAELIDMVQPGPDEGSRRLAAALRDVTFQRAESPLGKQIAPWLSRYHDGLTRATAGDQVADDLGIPNPLWKYAVPLTHALVTPIEGLRERLPGATWLSSQFGNLIWQGAVAQELGGKRPRFEAAAERTTGHASRLPRPPRSTVRAEPMRGQAYPSWRVPA